MTGKREIFDIIKTAVEAQGYFQEVDLFYNQFEEETAGREKILRKPALLVEFSDIQWMSQSGGLQKGEAVITFHMAIKWMRRDPGRVFDMEEKLQELLHVMEDHRVTFERLTENQNTNWGTLAVWTVSFGCLIMDTKGCPSLIEKDPPTELEINKEFVTSIDHAPISGGFQYPFNVNF